MGIQISRTLVVASGLWLFCAGAPEAFAQRYNPDGSVVADPVRGADDTRSDPVLRPDESRPADSVRRSEETQGGRVRRADESPRADPVPSSEERQGAPIPDRDSVQPDPVRPAD